MIATALKLQKVVRERFSPMKKSARKTTHDEEQRREWPA